MTVEDCVDYIENRGNGWVCENEGEILGFSIVDLIDCNIWALFVHPDFDQQGIGKKLHNIMLEWYFQKTKKTLWLGTDQGTRAETFYRKAGWVEIGSHGFPGRCTDDVEIVVEQHDGAAFEKIVCRGYVKPAEHVRMDVFGHCSLRRQVYGVPDGLDLSRAVCVVK